MNFLEYIKSCESSLADDWFKWIVESYPEPSRNYFMKKENAFTNPVGYNLNQSLRILLENICNGSIESKEFEDALTMILKIRSAQSIDPWQTVNFFEYLWIRYIEESKELGNDKQILNSIPYYHKLLAKSLSKFIEIQQLIAEIQKNEIRNQYGKILERLNQRYSLLKDENNQNK